MLREALLFAVTILCATNVRGEYKPKDERFDPKGCKKPDRELKGYVGVGYDELTGEFKATIYEDTFTKNVTTGDRCFLVPDGVSVTNIYDFKSEPKDISSYSLAETATAITYGLFVQSKMDTKGLGSLLSFSPAYEEAKKFRREDNLVTIINQANLTAFELQLEARRRIHPSLKSRLESMVLSYTKGFKQSAQHKAETIIRDYGTKVVSRSYTGALTSVFAWKKFHNQYFMEQGRSDVRLAAEDEFDFDIIAGKDRREYSIFERHLLAFKNSGGNTSTYTVGMKLQTSTSRDVVSFDNFAKIPQEFESITTIVDHANLTDNQTEIAKELLDEAVETYLKANTYRGCMDHVAANYNASVNVDDGSCVRYTAFGGFYIDSDVIQGSGRIIRSLNPVLDVNSCGDYGMEAFSTTDNKRVVFCYSRNHTKTSNLKKAYFGGMYHSIDTRNRLTNATGCPEGYQNYSMGPVVFDMQICLDISHTAKDAYEVSEFFHSCSDKIVHKCELNNFKEIRFTTFPDEFCYIGACVFKGTIEFKPDFGPMPAHRQLPFTAMEDENARSSTESANNVNDTNGSDDFFAENMTLVIVLIVVIAVLVLATVAFFVLRARRLSLAKGVAKPSKNSATGSTTSSSKNMNKDTTTSQATVGDNDRKTARSGANRSAPNTPAAKTAGTTTGATPK